jgi:AraC-like DNA-binding protein
MYDFLDLTVFASSCSLITMGFVYLLDNQKKADRVIIFIFFLIWGIDTILILWEIKGLYPGLLYLCKPFELFYGPLVYYHFRTLIERKIKIDLVFLLLFLPGILAVIYFIPFFVLMPANIGFHDMPNDAVRFIYLAIERMGTPWLVICILIFIVQAVKMLSAKSFKLILKRKILTAYCIMWMVISITGYILYIVKFGRLLHMIVIVTNVMIIIFYFIEKKYEKLFLLIMEDSSETKYKKSMIRNIDTGAVIERVKELMEFDKIYLDENLSLQSLSSMLGITPHQLSEILNSRLNANFRSFINTYRIKAAKKKIMENTNISIIQVAYECGFKSKNGFNVAFLKMEAMTPSEFKEKCSHARKYDFSDDYEKY